MAGARERRLQTSTATRSRPSRTSACFHARAPLLLLLHNSTNGGDDDGGGGYTSSSTGRRPRGCQHEAAPAARAPWRARASSTVVGAIYFILIIRAFLVETIVKAECATRISATLGAPSFSHARVQ